MISFLLSIYHPEVDLSYVYVIIIPISSIYLKIAVGFKIIP